MSQLGLGDARKLAEEYFPHGADEIAKRLGAKLHYSSLPTCHGWCVRGPKNAVIRINSDDSPARQAFTLAHELAHLLLGTNPDVLTSRTEPFSSNAHDEKAANQLASEMLLPESRIRPLVPEGPIDFGVVIRIAKAAGESNLATACRLASLAQNLGLISAGVAKFEGNRVQWMWAPGIRVSDDSELARLRDKALLSSTRFVRSVQDDGKTVTAFLLRDDDELFFQLLPTAIAGAKTPGEWLGPTREYLFQGDHKLEASLAGSLGVYKKNTSRPDRSARGFLERYQGKKWPFSRLRSSRGTQWLEYHLLGASPKQ